MKNITFYSLVIVCCLLAGGCHSTARHPSIEIGGLLIRNQTAGPIDNIKLKVEKTGAVVSCNRILPERHFATGFPLKRYQGNSVQISWQQNGRIYATGDLYAQIPDDLDTNVPAAAVAIILNNGLARVRLEQ